MASVLKLRNGRHLPRVLVVDDDEHLTYILREVLEEAGYEVRTAIDGRRGYLSYLYFKPDLVLTDIEMPAKNGLAMMRSIRFHNPQVKAVYMSADMERFQSEVDDERKRFGAVAVKKPFSMKDLVRAVAEQLDAAEVSPAAEPARSARSYHNR